MSPWPHGCITCTPRTSTSTPPPAFTTTATPTTTKTQLASPDDNIDIQQRMHTRPDDHDRREREATHVQDAPSDIDGQRRGRAVPDDHNRRPQDLALPDDTTMRLRPAPDNTIQPQRPHLDEPHPDLDRQQRDRALNDANRLPPTPRRLSEGNGQHTPRGPHPPRARTDDFG